MADSTILALDIGEKRIGVARANSIALIAEPLKTLSNDENFIENLSKIIEEQHATLLVVGIPKNLDDKPTTQTKFTNDFLENLQDHISVPIERQNEALSSVTAKDRLAASNEKYDKTKVDSMAAAVILETFIESNRSRVKELV